MSGLLAFLFIYAVLITIAFVIVLGALDDTTARADGAIARMRARIKGEEVRRG